MTDDTFDAELAAFLDDEQATGLPEAETIRSASSAYLASQRAIAETQGHVICEPDGRTRGVIVRVIGADDSTSDTIIPVGVNIRCYINALAADPAVVAVIPLGWAPDDEEPGDTNEDGVTVRSENPDLAVEWDSSPISSNVIPEVRDFPFTPLALVAAAAGFIAWRLLRRR